MNQAIDGRLVLREPGARRRVRAARERGGDVHLLGLVSHGGVHSHIDHLQALLELARRRDGDDVDPRLHRRTRRLAARGASTTSPSCPRERIATVVGRYYAMDRDERWERTERALAAIPRGEGERADDPIAAVRRATTRESRTSSSSRSSSKAGRASSRARRGDLLQLPARPRAPALAAAARARLRPDDDDAVPRGLRLSRSSFAEQEVPKTLAEVLAEHGVRQLHVAETEKYAHVTYFFNGGREEEWAGETRILVPSPARRPELRPEARDVRPRGRRRASSRRSATATRFAVVNFANPDMVGHTGSIPATVKAVETADDVPRPSRRARSSEPAASALDHGRPRERRADARGGRRQPAHGPYNEPRAARRHGPRGDPRRRRRAVRSRAHCAGASRTSEATCANDRQIANRVPGLIPGYTPAPLSLQQPDFGVLRKAQKGDERAFSHHRPRVRGAGLQLRPAAGRRPLAGRGSDAGGLPPRLPGPAEVLAPLEVHDLAVPGDEEPRARRAARASSAGRARSSRSTTFRRSRCVDAPFERLEAIDAVWRAVEALSVDLKMALLLRDVVGLSYTEIADSLEITLATVKWRIYKAREEVQLVAGPRGHHLRRGEDSSGRRSRLLARRSARR